MPMTVTMDLAELDALRARTRSLEEEIVQLKTRPPADIPVVVETFADAFQSALEVVRYAVANIPSDAPGWPRAAIQAVADALLRKLPSTDAQKEIGLSLAQWSGLDRSADGA